MEYVTFRATAEQLRELAVNVIEAAGHKRPNSKHVSVNADEPDEYGFAVWINKWRQKRVDLRVTWLELGLYRIVHGNFEPHRRRPWFKVFKTALAAVRSVEGIEVTSSMSRADYWAAGDGDDD